MKFSLDKQATFCIITIDEDRLNAAISPQFKSELALINAEGYKNIIIDFNKVKFVDSSGLSCILIGNRLCKDSDGSFVLTEMNENVKKLIDISQLDKILVSTPSLQEAKDIIIMEELEREINLEPEL